MAVFPLLLALTCSQVAPKTDRGVELVRVTESIDWTESAGVFIGIETFLAPSGAPPAVDFAADDATDLAWLFAKELDSLLPPDRVRLLLSGTPHKRASREHLLQLEKEGSVVSGSIDADTVYAQVREMSAKVGPDGVFVLSIATHGFTTAGAHVLLTPDATTAAPKGVLLDRLLAAIPAGHGRRVLLFVDACRKPTPAPARRFEELRFPGDYAIFAASGPGGYARGDGASQNGYFTRAVLDGLRGAAGPDAEGYVTPGTLDAFVGRDVRERTIGEQRPEARFGGLVSLPLFRIRDDVKAIASVVSPLPNALVDPQDWVEVRVDARGLFVTVLVCPASTGECFRQNIRAVRTSPGELARIGVQYGDTDVFDVHVALTADDAFLRGETRFPSVPHDRRAGRTVYWLKPVTVKRQEDS